MTVTRIVVERVLWTLNNYWLCEECEYTILKVVGEKSPVHCPFCYKKKDNVVEMNEIKKY